MRIDDRWGIGHGACPDARRARKPRCKRARPRDEYRSDTGSQKVAVAFAGCCSVFPARDACFTVFSQRLDARIDVGEWNRYAERFLGARVGLDGRQALRRRSAATRRRWRSWSRRWATGALGQFSRAARGGAGGAREPTKTRGRRARRRRWSGTGGSRLPVSADLADRDLGRGRQPRPPPRRDPGRRHARPDPHAARARPLRAEDRARAAGRLDDRAGFAVCPLSSDPPDSGKGATRVDSLPPEIGGKGRGRGADRAARVTHER